VNDNQPRRVPNGHDDSKDAMLRRAPQKKGAHRIWWLTTDGWRYYWSRRNKRRTFRAVTRTLIVLLCLLAVFLFFYIAR
jgi:hypothetical protein